MTDFDHELYEDAAACLAHAAPKGQFSEVVAHLRAIATGQHHVTTLSPEGAARVLGARFAGYSAATEADLAALRELAERKP